MTTVAAWQPTPFREFIVKVASRCDLKCDYCYMYEMADRGWRSQPRFMSSQTSLQVGRAIAEHVTQHDLTDISIILHGGEPLLAGATELARLTTRLREGIPGSTTVRVSVQTNGMLLNNEALETLHSAGIRISVSVDGDATSHDRHRRRPDGSGSYDTIVRALRLLGTPRYRDTFAGLLCVIDLANNPVEVYRALASHRPPVIDFLFPHGNWSSPPSRRPPDRSTPYGDWLADAFDEWYDSPPGRPEVRLFREILTLLLGGRSRTEQVGLSPAAMVVVNVDGAIEQVDSLRSAYEGAVTTGTSIAVHSFDDALRHPAIATRQLGVTGLAPQCRRCPLVPVCGGGNYPHRYRAGHGFTNPSVYCADLEKLIRHVRDRALKELSLARRTVS